MRYLFLLLLLGACGKDYQPSDCMCSNPFSMEQQMILDCTVITRFYQPPIITCKDKSGNEYYIQEEK